MESESVYVAAILRVASMLKDFAMSPADSYIAK